MSIDIKDTITLSDDKTYGVVSKTILHNKVYYYLIDTVNNENIKFCFQDNNELVEIEDQFLIQNLLPLFANEIKQDISNILLEQN